MDSFDYSVTDGKGGADTATVTISVTSDPGSTQLRANADVLVTSVGQVESVDVLANDDGSGVLSLISSSDPAHGAIECTDEGLCTYTPDAGFVGYDGFTYTMYDDSGDVATGTVEITVAANATHVPKVDGAAVVGGSTTSLTQGASARWTVSAVAEPAGVNGTTPSLQREDLDSVVWRSPVRSRIVQHRHGLDSHDDGDRLPTHRRTERGARRIRFAAATCAEQSDLAGNRRRWPRPDPRRQQGLRVFHHSFPTSITCIDRTTGERCQGYPKLLNMGTDNINGPGAVVGAKIWVHLRTSFKYIGGAYAMYCWDTSTDQPCGLVVLDHNDSGGDGSAPVLAAGKIWGMSASGDLHCLDPATSAPCTVPKVHTDLAGSGAIFDIVTDGTRVYAAMSTLNKVACVDATTAARCSGWPTSRVLPQANNIVNQFNAVGQRDGICSVGQSNSFCVDRAGGDVVLHGGWPNADGYYNVTQEAETGTRTFWGALGPRGSAVGTGPR